MILSEEDGNYIVIDDSKNVYLKLRTEPRARKLGRVTKKGLIVRRVREKHLHKLSNSYGFNYLMLKLLPDVKTVILRDDFGEYEIPADVIRAAPCMRFKKAADGNEYELQHYLSLAYQYKPTEKEFIDEVLGEFPACPKCGGRSQHFPGCTTTPFEF